ncbi:MAG: Holliday junction resolvase RuvX [Bacteroidota bacterium]
MSLTDPPRLVGVDYGSRRVGLAVADPLGLFARPLGTYAPGEALDVLARLGAEAGIEAVIVGWPLLDDGAEGQAVDRVKPFVGRLRKAVPGVRVELQDERDSSRRAMANLVEAGVPRGARRKKATLDAVAACVILQDWIDERT